MLTLELADRGIFILQPTPKRSVPMHYACPLQSNGSSQKVTDRSVSRHPKSVTIRDLSLNSSDGQLLIHPCIHCSAAWTLSEQMSKSDFGSKFDLASKLDFGFMAVHVEFFGYWPKHVVPVANPASSLEGEC